MRTGFRPLLGPPDWQSCDCIIGGKVGDESVDLYYRRASGAALRVSLGRGEHAGVPRFFRNTRRKWEAQERELHEDVAESKSRVVIGDDSRPLTVGSFGPGLWAALTDDDAPLTVWLSGEEWPLDDLMLVEVPVDAFPVDEEEDEFFDD